MCPSPSLSPGRDGGGSISPITKRDSSLLTTRLRGGLPAALIVVTNEVGAGLVPAYPSGRLFRDLLGLANQRLAANADTVHYLVAGLPLTVKGPGDMMRPEAP